jgi:hypothetical protein
MSDNLEIIVREARHIDELEIYEKSWDQLLRKCPESTPTQTFAWLYAFLNTHCHQTLSGYVFLLTIMVENSWEFTL